MVGDVFPYLSFVEFKVVEALSIDANYTALADKCRGVHLVDDVENLTRLAFLRQHKQHLDVASRIEPLRVEHGDSTVGFLIDAAGYLLVMARDDEELYRTAPGVHHLVDAESGDAEHHIAINHFFQIMKHEVGRGYDEDVAKQNHTAQGDVAVFVHDGRDNIGASCASVERQAQAHATSTENGTDDARHKRLVLKQVHLVAQVGEKRQKQCEYADGINRLEAKAETQNPERCQQQEGVDAKVTYRHRHPQAPIQE